MKALSLFSGIGGIDLACEWAGIETVAFCEREPFPQKVLRKHWPDVPIYDDVCTLTKERLEADGIGTIELIHGGYPCQPFSNAGQRKGTEDDRHLWPEVFRLIQTLQPRWFVGENVAGHISLGLDIVLADLESIGYAWETFVLPAAAVDSPNRRDRVFIVGYSECVRLHWQSWWGAEPLSKDRYKRMEEGFMANSTSERLSQWGRSEWAESDEEKGPRMEPRAERCCEIMANTQSERCGEAREYQSNGPAEWITGCSEDVANTSCAGWEEFDVAPLPDRSGYNSGRSNEAGASKAIKPGLGGSANGFPYRMDEHRWPAPYGAEQYEWEPPRVAIGVKNRVGRLKSLGNAVNPHQIYPVIAAIKIIDAMNIR